MKILGMRKRTKVASLFSMNRFRDDYFMVVRW